MLSKQVKARIANNKQRRTVPMWKRAMRAFFISQLPASQSVLSSKHFDVLMTVVEVEAAAKELVSRSVRANEIFAKMSTWTRHDWYAFTQSGDEHYSQYIARHQEFQMCFAQRKHVFGSEKPSFSFRDRPLDINMNPGLMQQIAKNIPQPPAQPSNDMSNAEEYIQKLDLTGNADPEQLLDLVKTNPNAEWHVAFKPTSEAIKRVIEKATPVDENTSVFGTKSIESSKKQGD